MGISDISSSEAHLRRLADICERINSKPGQNRAALFRSIKLLGINNEKIVERHLAILQKINLLQYLGEIYAVTADGKALSRLTNERVDRDELSSEERSCFFKTLMTSVAKRQLLELLHSVEGEKKGLPKDVIKRYFSTDFARRLWNRDIVDKNLAKLNSEAKMPRFFEHKFRCMETWLEDLLLVAKSRDRLLLTDGAKVVLPKIQQDLRNEIYHITSSLYYPTANDFDFNREKRVYVTLFRRAFSFFRSDTGASDLRAIRTYVCIKLLATGLILEEDGFDETISLLSDEGVIRSVILGRNGKPYSITLHKLA